MRQVCCAIRPKAKCSFDADRIKAFLSVGVNFGDVRMAVRYEHLLGVVIDIV